MGELINLNPLTITDANIPAAIARDTETAAAIAAHAAAADPHPNLWTRITSAFLALTGGQQIIRNNPAIASDSFLAPKNHFELATNNGSNPILGFHRGGFSATALYHSGYGNNSLRIRNADGFDGALLHEGNHIAAANPHPQYPRFFRAIYSSQCPATANQTVTVTHGLTVSNIRSFTAFATLYPNTISEMRIQPGGVGLPSWVGGNCYYSVDIGPINISIRTNANSATIANAPLTIVVDHV